VSWIICRRSDGKAIFETFNRKTAYAVNLDRYSVETAAEYLGRINREIRAAGCAD
jgi:hypothetical protein